MNGPLIEWGLAEQSLPGEMESGDRHVVKLSGNQATLAVIDGLGHGAEAAAASKAAVEVLEAFWHEPVLTLFGRCHERLRSTRGAAMTVALFDADAGTLTWLGAGNVKAILLRPSPVASPDWRDLLVHGGVVGAQLPAVEPSSLSVNPGDVLVLATDGVNPYFVKSLRYGEEPQRQADRLLAHYRSETDDALVLVVRLNR